MPIITISRGSYSRGKEVAEKLAERLGYECISRDIIVEASGQFNIPEIKLIKALHDAPSVLERFNHGQEKFINYFKSSFLTHMAKGNIVYHGLAGHFFLQGISHVLKVRITARMSDRIEAEMAREKCSESEARHKLRKDDEERRKWGLQLYGKDTWDSRLYDMVFCVDSLTVDDIVDIIVSTAQKKQFQETEQSVADLHSRMLAANVMAMVIKVSPHVRVRMINESEVELYHIDGRLKNEKEIRQELTQRLESEFGIKKVVFREDIQPYKGYINTFFNLNIDEKAPHQHREI